MHKFPRSDESQRLPDRAFVLIASSINLPHRIADRKYCGMSGNGAEPHVRPVPPNVRS